MSNENKLVKLSDLGAVAAELEAEITALDNGKADVIISTASGPVASFSDGADGMPVEDLIIDIEPMQSGSGDPSPSNVRPITGWTGANVVVSPTTDAQDGTTYPISWQSEAGTVYGGTLDVTSGVLTVTHNYLTDNGSLNWSMNSDGSFYTANPSAVALQDKSGCMCNYAPFSIDFNGLNVFFRTNGLISLGRDWGSVYPSVQALKSAFSSVPIQFVYKLATPQTYQLDPVTVSTLLGQNNIWADCGPIEKLEYKANTGMYFDKKLAAICDCIAPTEDGATASQAYAQGKYFFHNGSFCKAKTAIASGATFTLGTNYEVTTVAAELYNALNT